MQHGYIKGLYEIMLIFCVFVFYYFQFAFLMTEAILMFSPQSSVFPSSTRATKAQIHWMIQAASITCTSLGFAAIFYNKNQRGKDHFTSWHGLFGLVTMILVLLQAFQGISIYYQKFSLMKASLGQRKQLHALVGVLVFTLACFTIVLGYFSNWFVKNVNDAVWWGSVLSTLAMTGVIMGQVANEFVAKNKPLKQVCSS